MSGTKFLLDINIIIGIVKGNDESLTVLQDRSVEIDMCAYSFISRIELLGYPGITDVEIEYIQTILGAMQYLPIAQLVEDMAIQIRRQYKLKIPDAIIAATAKVSDLELITLDQQLANRMVDILNID
ncbi:type II toxin-antitoxin system VapC family toxin [Nodosilinea nodulosa]|uniref:type II toxin-antitoxin system VapC family toxin n=1 Tax=Nodosilinea nodulosa TaxID=416001 RepID=UPI0002DC73AC|nr:type II toxin-antitoxin system VapC family toxin [Nodosilinea nodulosa]